MEILYALLLPAAAVVVTLVAVTLRRSAREPRRKTAWAPISSMIGGTFSSKSGLLYERHQINGSYQGIPVEVSINGYTPEDDPAYFTYHLKIAVRTRRAQWALRVSDTELPGRGSNWYVESSDKLLERQLTEAVDADLIKTDPGGILPYSCRVAEETFEYETSVSGDTSLPTPHEFDAQFKLLRHLADLNERFNVS